MNTFWRYFLHFTSIPLILFIIMGIHVAFDSSIKINGIVVLLFIAPILEFSLPMTIFYFYYVADNETISITLDNSVKLLQTLDATIKSNLKNQKNFQIQYILFF